LNEFLKEIFCSFCGYKLPPTDRAELSLCPLCKGSLTISYNYEALSEKLNKDELARRPGGLWKYVELLPLLGDAVVTLGEGGTTLLKCERLGRSIGLRDFYAKNETTNPTGSFLDRGSSVAVSRLLYAGYKGVVCTAGGNLGASISAYAAKAGMPCKVYVPKRVDLGKLHQMVMFGASVEVLEPGSELPERLYGYYHLTPADPFFMEGLKTISYEIAEELSFRAPDVTVVPMGNGGLISMVWKGYLEWRRLGLVDGSLGRLIGVQVEPVSPIYDKFAGSKARRKPSEEDIIFPDIMVKSPLHAKLALKCLRESGGGVVLVKPKEVVEAMKFLARYEGIFAEPAGSAAVAGVKKAVAQGLVDRNELVVCVITGSGFKDPKAVCEVVDLSREGPIVPLRKRPTRIGRTKLMILEMLLHNESYGYEIAQRLRREKRLRTTVANVYQHLRELERAGYVAVSGIVVVRGRKRKKYKITKKGEWALKLYYGESL